MTSTPPEPLPPVAPATPAAPAVTPGAAIAPASPYAAAPVTGYAATPVDPRREKNPFGIAALVFTIVSILVPIGFLIAPIVATAASGNDIGWGVLGGIVFFVIGLAPAAGLALIAVILAIVSLVRSNRKALGIVVLVLSGPVVLVGLLTLPAFLNGDFF